MNNDNDNKFYCADLDQWFDSMYELNEAVFGNMQWPSAEEESQMIRGANISAAKKGKPGPPKTAEHNANLSAAQKGKPKSAEHNANISAAKKGKPSKIKGKPKSAEHNAKVSAAKKGKSHSEESKIKMAAAKKAYWAQRRAEKAAAQALTSDGNVS